jgi:hypothetical protein
VRGVMLAHGLILMRKYYAIFGRVRGNILPLEALIQDGTRTNFILRCLYNITSNDKCIIWLSIYTMKKIVRALC